MSMDLQPLSTLPTQPFDSYTYLSSHRSLPPTPHILSRPSSATRLRSFYSNSRSIPTSTSTPAFPPIERRAPRKLPTGTKSASATGTTTPYPQDVQSRRARQAVRDSKRPEDDWISRTASTLTLARLEEKGVSWLATRDSSTSLTGIDVDADDEYETATGGGTSAPSPQWVRSRVQSRRPSAMWLDEGQAAPVKSGGVEPEWVNVIENEDAYEEDIEDGVDEREMKRVVMGRVGGWIDWAVGWVDFKGEDDESMQKDDYEDGAPHARFSRSSLDMKRGELDVAEVRRRLGKREKEESDEAIDEVHTVDPPPAGEEAGLLSDARWLLRVATKLAL